MRRRSPTPHTFLSRGFTLLELLLFVSIAAMLMGTLSVFVGLLLESRVKQQTIVEVEEQGVQAMELIIHAIHNASSITAPGTGATSTTLSLSGTAQTVFEHSTGRLWQTLGAGVPVAMTSSGVVVSNVQFSNVARAATPGIIRAQLTLSRVNPDGRNEYDYRQTFYGSASVRY